MWKTVAALGLTSFIVLVLTYLSSYVVPGAHAYVASLMVPLIGGKA